MVDKRTTPTPTPATDEAFGPRRVDSPRVDGERRDSNQPGDSPSSSAQEPRRSSERPIHGNSGNGEAQVRVIEGTSGASGSTGTPPRSFSQQDNVLQAVAPNPFTASSNILQEIATRFNAARDQSRAGAWRQIQIDLMNASPFICPVLIPYKDLLSVVADIEKEIKGANTQVGKSNEELLADFLSGGREIPISPSPEPATLTEGESI